MLPKNKALILYERLRDDNIVWKSVWDQMQEITNYMYLVSAIPANYLISAEGEIVGYNL